MNIGKLAEIHSSYGDGLRLLEDGEFAGAREHFQGRLGEDSPIPDYGIATASYRENDRTATVEQMLNIIQHYEKAIELDPSFSDAHFMLGMAYSGLSSAMLRSWKKNPHDDMGGRVESIKQALADSQEHLSNSSTLDERFTHEVKNQLSAIQRRLTAIPNLEKHYSNSNGAQN